MSDLKSYLQGHLKTIKGLDMSGLIDTCGISRAKFYKCLKEPWRFDDIDLERIAQKMDLDEKERTQLFGYKHTLPSVDEGSAGEDLADLKEKDRLYELAEKIFWGQQEIPTDCKRKIFTILREKDSGRTNAVYSADELADEIYSDMAAEAATRKGKLLDIRIFNAHDDGMIGAIFGLLKSLNRFDPYKRIDAVAVMHYVGDVKTPLEDRLAMYSDWYRLMAYSQYQLEFTDKLDGSFFSSWNGCVIRYTDCKRIQKYLMVNILSADDAVVFSFTDENLFEFVRYGCADLFGEDTLSDMLSTDAVKVSNVTMNGRQKHRTIALTAGPCLDHILPDIYDELVAKLLSKNSEWSGYDALICVADAKNMHEMFGKQQTIRFLFDMFKQRFNTDRKEASLNLLPARELKCFATNRQNIDMRLVDIQLDKDQTIRQLRYFKEHLDGTENDGRHHFYLINSSITTVDKMMVIFKDYCMGMIRVPKGMPELYNRTVADAEIANVFYGYVVDRLLSEENRSKPHSPVMSKAMAEAFIDGLIEEVKKADD